VFYYVEFIKFEDGKPEARTVCRLSKSHDRLEDAMAEGRRHNNGIFDNAHGFRVIKTVGGKQSIVAHRFRGQE
jgi:hypothetical protein